MKRNAVLVLGADGYLGWPMSLHLSNLGHDVVAVDSLVRRTWDDECGTRSLAAIQPMTRRVVLWNELSGRTIAWRQIDLSDARAVFELLQEYRPDAVIHFAEQRSAPFSMIDRAHAVETQVRNVTGTLNVLFAIHEVVPDCHLIKLGTMGEYGTPNIDIEEGWIDIQHKGRTDRLPFPKMPGSFYHLSKVHDSHNIMFCCRIWGVRATDLNQGVVYGVHTPETQRHPELTTRFDYDSIWGTALNRSVRGSLAWRGTPSMTFEKSISRRAIFCSRRCRLARSPSMESPTRRSGLSFCPASRSTLLPQTHSTQRSISTQCRRSRDGRPIAIWRAFRFAHAGSSVSTKRHELFRHRPRVSHSSASWSRVSRATHPYLDTPTGYVRATSRSCGDALDAPATDGAANEELHDAGVGAHGRSADPRGG